MKISDTSATYGRQIYMREAADASQADGQEAKAREKAVADKVTLSQDSREMQIARDAVMNAPEVRAEKVEALRNEVKEGRYVPPVDKVADKIIASAINEYV